MTESAARAELASILKPINDGLSERPAAITLGSFIETEYLPQKRRRWKRSTKDTTEQLIFHHLTPELGDMPIAAITRKELQKLLDTKAAAGKIGFSTLSRLRWQMQAIFEMAKSDGLIRSNPADSLDVPRAAKATPEKRTLTGDQVKVILQTLPIRERLFFCFGALVGLRPGETLSLKVGDVQEWSPGKLALAIERRLYRGDLDIPKNGKKRLAAIGGYTRALLGDWLELLPDQGAEAWVFPSERVTTPLCASNYWNRVVKPKLAKLGLDWATPQVWRRSNGTMGEVVKTDTKAAAAQRGHGVGVMLEKYVIPPIEAKFHVVAEIEKAFGAATEGQSTPS